MSSITCISGHIMHGHFLERVDSCGRNVISYFIYSSKETSPHHGIHAHLNVKLLIMQCKMLMLSRRFSGLQMKKDTCSLEDPSSHRPTLAQFPTWQSRLCSWSRWPHPTRRKKKSQSDHHRQYYEEAAQGTDVSGCQLIAMPGEAFLA